ncbi:MAG: hypothetical protein R3F46_05960 [bacterium]
MKKMLVACLLLLAAILASCGGSGGVDSTLESRPAAEDSSLGSGLPAFADLAAGTTRDLSIAGPGWYTLDLEYRNFGRAEQGVTEDLPALDIAGAGSPGFCVFGVNGFEGDAFPTGLRADVSDVSGEYYLLYTSYVDGRWITAGPFTESAAYEYPEVDGFTDPQALASARSNHFVAILVPDGSSLQLDMLQLGVHGGSEGPEEVWYVEPASSEDTLTIVWEQSASHADPDFAGYTVERRPWPGGSFTSLFSDPMQETHYSDPTAEQGKVYLYRIVTWDTSGNSAPSYNSLASRQAGQLSPPVPVVSMPRGPLYGPVEVTFDLSASFDNDGDAITDYGFDLGFGIPPVNQPTPQFTTLLQPGCYTCAFTVTSGADTRETHGQLKVYPQWQESSQLVTEGTELIYRSFAPRSFHDPISDKDVFIYMDAAVPSLVSLTVDAAGNVDRHDNLFPSEGGLVVCSEPVFSNGVWSFLAVTEQPGSPGEFNMYMATWQDNAIEVQLATGNSVRGIGSALVDDGNDNLYGIYFDFNIGYDIRIVNFNNFSSAAVITGLIENRIFDAVWNADAEAIDLVFSGSGNVEWLRWSPVIGPLASATLMGVDSQYIELENDPDTGRPAVLFHDGSAIQFAELNPDNATWTVPAKVDPADNDLPQCRLLFRDGRSFCTYGDSVAGTRLYRRNGAVWDVVNTASHPIGGGYITMEYLPSVPGFHVLDVASDYRARLVLMQEDDSEQQLWEGPGWKRNGLELSSAASATELHILHKPGSNYLHFTSPDAQVWTETTDAGNGTGGRIAADENGEVYATLVNGGNAYLRHWVDPAWVDVHTNPVSPDCLPFIFGQGQTLFYGSFDGTAAPVEFHYKRGGNPADLILPQTTVIWDGALAGRDVLSGRILVRYGGMEFGDGSIGFLDGSGEISPLFGCDLSLFDNDWTLGRHMEGALFTDKFHDRREVFYVAYGPEGYLVRLSSNSDVPWQIDLIPGAVAEYQYEKYVRSVSATTAWGTTSLGLGTGLLGEVFFFEWDDFGAFESLPWPAGLDNTSLHELVVGPDGRWHIIYRDNVTEDLRVISTI